MLGQTWYFSLIRKYVILMGYLLNDIAIERTDANNNVTEVITVPVTYSPKEKMLTRLKSDPRIDRAYSELLPRISFQLNGVAYDGDRKLPTMNFIALKNVSDSNKAMYQYTPVPWNFNFQATIFSKNVEDTCKIVEQIIPFFTPNYTARVMLVPAMNETRDIPVVLNSGDIVDLLNEQFTERQIYLWDLNFTVKGFLYQPIRQAPLIKYANVSSYIYDPDKSNQLPNSQNKVIEVLTQPGLTANGQPTSNAAQSIPVSEIFLDDDFGYVVTRTDFDS